MKKILHSWCIICEMDVGYTCNSKIGEGSRVSSSSFVKLWPLFCKYFKLSGHKYESVFQFHVEMKPFVSPFCGMCSREVSALLTLHEELQSTMAKIRNSMTKISTTVRQSIEEREEVEEEQTGTGTGILEETGEENGGIKRDDFTMSQIQDLREFIIRGYKLQVVLSHEERNSEKTDTVELYPEPEPKQKPQRQPEPEGVLTSKLKLTSSLTSSNQPPQNQSTAATTAAVQKSKATTPQFVCDICSETFVTRKLLMTHRQSHNWSLIQQFNPKRIIPKIGSPGTFIVPGAGELKQIRRENKDKAISKLAFQCCTCQLIEETIGSMIVHIREFHPNLQSAPDLKSVSTPAPVSVSRVQRKPEQNNINHLQSNSKPTVAARTVEEAQVCPPVKRARMTVIVQGGLKGRGKVNCSSPSSSSSSFKTASTSAGSSSYTSSPLSSSSSSSSGSINYSENEDNIKEQESARQNGEAPLITISDSSESTPEIYNDNNEKCPQSTSTLFLHGRWLYAQLEVAGDENVLKCIECGRMGRSHDEIIQHIQHTHDSSCTDQPNN